MADVASVVSGEPVVSVANARPRTMQVGQLVCELAGNGDAVARYAAARKIVLNWIQNHRRLGALLPSTSQTVPEFAVEEDLFERRREALSIKPISRSGGETTFTKYSSAYEVPWGSNGEKRTLEWHLEKGGGRDERYFLRIYFFWDEESEQVVVGWIPSHLPNSLT